MEKTVNQILENNDGDVVTNARIKSYTMVYVLVNRFGLIIEGDMWKRATMGDLRQNDNVVELHVLPNGRQDLKSIHDSKVRYMVTTTEDLRRQIENMQ